MSWVHGPELAAAAVAAGAFATALLGAGELVGAVIAPELFVFTAAAFVDAGDVDLAVSVGVEFVTAFEGACALFKLGTSALWASILGAPTCGTLACGAETVGRGMLTVGCGTEMVGRGMLTVGRGTEMVGRGMLTVGRGTSSAWAGCAPNIAAQTIAGTMGIREVIGLPHIIQSQIL
jgi:hypothetical protein